VPGLPLYGKVPCMKTVILVLCIAFSFPMGVLAADADACKDSPLIKRFPGCTIARCSDMVDDLVTFPRQQPLEGEIHRISYSCPDTLSKAEIYRNNKTALANARFTFPWDTSADSGDFLAHSGKNWILEESHGSSYTLTVAVEIKLTQLVTANPNGSYGAIAQVGASGTDASGCTDSPLVTRFPKSIIAVCSDKSDTTATLPVGKEQKTIEGEVHMTRYSFPPTSSKAQVYRNLKTALQSAGFSIVYDTSAEIAAFTVQSGKNWIREEAAESSPFYTQTVVVETRLAQEVTADAAAIYGSLAKNGHAAVYGILFDTGKAEVKPSSAAALKEIVNVLKKEPTLKVYVVGHTDDVGDVASNLDLSRRRAAAVVKALVTEYGIAPNILDSFGAGPYAPVASNDKEEGGRALNRRVELVKQ
jgi:OOP family OmpA-OmpF porin